MDGKSCKKCSENPGAEGLIPLWDGHAYCRACVEAASPGLAEFATEHPTFEAAIGYGRAEALREVYTMMAYFGFGIATVAAVLVAASGAGTSAIPIAAGMVLFGLVILYLTMLLQVNAGPRRLPRVRIEGGQVQVFRAAFKAGKFPMSRFSLAACTWHLGLLREDSAARGRGDVIGTTAPAVIVKALHKPYYPYSATGSTPEIRERLVGFLRLAGIAEAR